MKLFAIMTIFSTGLFFFLPALYAEKEFYRSPAVAGQFYPSDKIVLGRMIDGFMQKAAVTEASSQAPSVLIVPHAGYVYSGPTAAYAYKLLEGKNIETVVLIGPSHHANFPGASVWPKGAWQTPLGQVPIDTETAEAILKAYPEAGSDPSTHIEEHSLETQVPFLQKVLGNFKIVPILTNDHSAENCQKLARAVLSATEGKRAVVVISTDMSHYYPAKTANEMDHSALQLVQKNDIEELRKKLALDKVEFCGSTGVLTAMEMARLAGGPKIKLLNYSDSGDSSGDKTRVVGYGALAFYFNKPQTDQTVTPVQKKQLLEIARRTVELYVTEGKTYEPPIKDNFLKEKRAAFVTLRTHGQLRGCIGSLMPQEVLYLAVRNMAVSAATQDPRFHPVGKDELKDLSYEISVLSVPVKAKNADEIVMGKHGVIVKHGFHSGVFLPKVAEETGWSKEEFLNELCSQKAGLAPDAWKDPATELYIFSAEEFSEKDLNQK